MKTLTVITAVALAIATPSASYAFASGPAGIDGPTGAPLGMPGGMLPKEYNPAKVKATWQCVFSFGTNKDACAAAK